MKKTVFLCMLSAVLGAMAALVLLDPPSTLPTTVAQEPRSPHLLPRDPSNRLTAPPRVAAGTWGEANTQLPLGDEELTPEERVNVAVYEHANRSVVNINTTVHSDGLLWDAVSEGEGSGSVLDHQGHILTNFHVIGEAHGAKQIQVTLFNGKTYEARLVGGDPTTDVAVLKIEAPRDELYPLVFGDSARLRVGQRVYAIGNPFGLERTLSTGIISSLNRTLPNSRTNRPLKQMIQIDAALNPGNSGGPLLDSHSRMIGMNTAIASKSGTSAGVGFAIPVSTIARIVPQLIQNGRVVRPDVGIARVYQTERGLLLATLVPGGAAERAGLQGPKLVRRTKRQGPFVYEYQTIDRSVADMIVAVDGTRIRTADDFLSAIERHQPGDRVIITVVRAGKEVNIPVILDAGD
jgi:S1-C subfamily serine protease